jgi:hypothetical protein
MTCSACIHFPRCAWLVGALPSWTECDWIPSRFVPAHPASERSSATGAPGAEALAKSDVAALSGAAKAEGRTP